MWWHYRFGQFPFRGFSLHPDGKSFLTSINRMKSQIYLMVRIPGEGEKDSGVNVKTIPG